MAVASCVKWALVVVMLLCCVWHLLYFLFLICFPSFERPHDEADAGCAAVGLSHCFPSEFFLAVHL